MVGVENPHCVHAYSGVAAVVVVAAAMGVGRNWVVVVVVAAAAVVVEVGMCMERWPIIAPLLAVTNSQLSQA